jgi:hypothetical protein
MNTEWDVKVKLSLCLIKLHVSVWGSGAVTPRVITHRHYMEVVSLFYINVIRQVGHSITNKIKEVGENDS